MANFKEKLEKIAVTLLYGLIFIMPWQTKLIIKAGYLNGFHEYGTLSIYASDILIFIILTAIVWFTGRKTISKKIIFSLGAIILISFVSIFYSHNKDVALFGFYRLLLGVGLFLILDLLNYNKIKLFLTFVISASLQAVLGLLQFFTQETFANKYLGLALHEADKLGTSVIELTTRDGFNERWLRAYGGLDHPNILGGLLAIAIIISVYLFINKYNKNKMHQTMTIIFACVIILFSGLLLSFSRSALLALLAGLVVLILPNFKKAIKIIPAIIIPIFIFLPTYSELFFSRLDLNNRLENKSITERLAGYDEASIIIKNNPIIGVGINNYTNNLHDLYPKKNSYYYQPIHNIFVLIIAELGIIGLLIYLIFFSLLLKNSLNKEDKFFNLAIFIFIIIVGLFDHYLISMHFGILLLWFLLGIINKNSRELKEPAVV